MRLSEIIIIYLAAAAPFGVANFLQRPSGVPRPRSIFKATGAALLWPFSLLLSRPLVQKRFRRRAHKLAGRSVAPIVSPSPVELRVEEAQRALLSVLYRMEDLAQEVSNPDSEAAREAVREARVSVERYAGLALAVAGVIDEAETTPSTREMELCRLAGRTGDDLLIAGRCHARRNRARLSAHHADARLELLHALAELREVCERTHATTKETDAAVARPLFAALLETYARAFDLLSLLEDQRAAVTVARLLDAACARLRRIESAHLQAAPESLVQQDMTGKNVARPKDEPCTTSTTLTNTQPQPSPSPTSRAHV